MPLYRPTPVSDSASSAGGGSSSGAEGALHAFQNLRHITIVTVAESASSAAAPAFAKPSVAVTETVTEVLPKIEIGGGGISTPSSDFSISASEISSSATGAIKGIMDLAGKLADPMGFLSFFFSFLQALFTQSMVSSMIPALRPEFLYSQAAQAAIDCKHWQFNS